MKEKMNIRLFKPSLGKEELEKVEEVFSNSWVGLGPKVNEFEKRWANYVNAEIAIGLNSATAALHLALAAFNFKKGKKVLVPSLTFSSTASAVLYNDLIPVFVDSDPETLGIDIKDLKKKYDLKEIVKGDSIFCATGITSGDLVKGVEVKDHKFITETLVTHKNSNMCKIVIREDTIKT